MLYNTKSIYKKIDTTKKVTTFSGNYLFAGGEKYELRKRKNHAKNAIEKTKPHPEKTLTYDQKQTEHYVFHFEIVYSFLIKKKDIVTRINPNMNMGENIHTKAIVMVCLMLFSIPFLSIVLSTKYVKNIPMKYIIPRTKYIITM